MYCVVFPVKFTDGDGVESCICVKARLYPAIPEASEGSGQSNFGALSVRSYTPSALVVEVTTGAAGGGISTIVSASGADG